MNTPNRVAVVFGRDITPERVAAFLPSNYSVLDADQTGRDGDTVVIGGHDNAGWTLDGYVIPRLASGLLFAEEIVLPTDDPAGWGSEEAWQESVAEEQAGR